jgi:hypothetical protein
MSALRNEIALYIKGIPESKLKALKPLLELMAQEEDFLVETDLTDEEREICAQARKKYKKGDYVPFDFT